MSRIVGIHTPENGSNLIDNAEGMIFARQAAPLTPTAYNDNAYAADRWKILCEANAVNASQSAVAPVGAATSILLTKATAIGRFGMIQFKEASETLALRTRQVTFKVAVRGSALTTQAKIAILSWSGTADAPTTDVVSVWGASPTYIANVTELASKTATINASAFTTVFVTATVPANANNLAFFVFTPNSQAIADSLYISAMSATVGTGVSPYAQRDVEEEASRCMRYYEALQFYTYYEGRSASNAADRQFTPWMVRKRANPVLSTPGSFTSSSSIAGGTLTTTDGFYLSKNNNQPAGGYEGKVIADADF